MTILGDKIRDKLKKASAGEPDTWGFVSMFMDMIEEAEKETASDVDAYRQAVKDLLEAAKKIIPVEEYRQYTGEKVVLEAIAAVERLEG